MLTKWVKCWQTPKSTFQMIIPPIQSPHFLFEKKISDGKVVNSLISKINSSILNNAPKAEGIDPSSLLFDKSNTRKLKGISGMFPVSWLLERLSSSRSYNQWKTLGIGPFKPVLEREIILRCGICPNSEIMFVSNSLPDISIDSTYNWSLHLIPSHVHSDLSSKEKPSALQKKNNCKI